MQCRHLPLRDAQQDCKPRRGFGGGDRLRVSAQLIQVRDQTHLWAETYDAGMRDLVRLLLAATPVVTLFVRTDNAPAIRLYESIGMRLVGRYRSLLHDLNNVIGELAGRGRSAHIAGALFLVAVHLLQGGANAVCRLVFAQVPQQNAAIS